MTDAQTYDVVIYGASGYTGRLVAQYLNTEYGSDGEVSWAMAGRSAEKLSAVRSEMGIPDTVDLVVADADDSAALKAMAEKAKCVITTTGPYQLYGDKLVAACVEAGTDYVDLCGEPTWMHETIAKFGAAAKASGARIVHSCGFDSIPFDLGVWFFEQEAKKRFGKPIPRVRGRVRKMVGKFSGGTAYSLNATMANAKKNPALFDVLRNPFSLADGFQGPEQPHGMEPIEETDIGSWSAPFIMAPINTKNIHRSNALLGHDYGTDFVYDEMMLTGPGDKGKAIAEAVGQSNPLGGDDAPKPGEGPTKEEREAGHFDVMFIGATDAGEALRVGVTGDKDPGYGCTCKMITESALTLVKEVTDTPGGIFTPAAIMAEPLIARLRAHAGMTFEVEA